MEGRLLARARAKLEAERQEHKREEYRRLDEVMALMKKYGERVEQRVSPVFGGTDPATDTPTTIQVPARCGGVVLFVLDVDQSIRF